MAGSTDSERRCPDDGACHHSCLFDECFRVRTCAPLSSYGEDWRPEDVERFGGPSKQATIEDVIAAAADEGMGC